MSCPCQGLEKFKLKCCAHVSLQKKLKLQSCVLIGMTLLSCPVLSSVLCPQNSCCEPNFCFGPYIGKVSPTISNVRAENQCQSQCRARITSMSALHFRTGRNKITPSIPLELSGHTVVLYLTFIPHTILHVATVCYCIKHVYTRTSPYMQCALCCNILCTVLNSR